MAQKNSAEGAKVNEKGLGSFSAFYSHIMNRRGMAPRPSAGRNIARSSVYIPQLIPAILLVAYGAIVIWSASLSIADARFSRHLMGIAIGVVMDVLIWRYDYRALANMTTAMLVTIVILMFLPKVPGLSYTALGMTGWIKIPIIGMTYQPS